MSSRPNTPKPMEHREMAFETWLIRAGKSPSKAASILQSEGYDITRENISQWRIRDSWDEKAMAYQARLAPAMTTETLGNIVTGGLVASRTLLQMLDNLEQGRQPTMAAVRLVESTLAMAGFSPIGATNPIERAKQTSEGRSKLVERYFPEDEIASLMANLTDKEDIYDEN